MPSVGKSVENMDPYTWLVGEENGQNPLENSLVASTEAGHPPIPWAATPLPKANRKVFRCEMNDVDGKDHGSVSL